MHLKPLMLDMHLQKTWKFDGFRTVNIRLLFVGMKGVVSGKIIYVPITDSPHYSFAQECLNGEPVYPSRGYRDYSHYVEAHPHQCKQKEFKDLVRSIKDNGYDAQKSPIMVFRSWRRPFPLGRWDVADGFHRLSILAALGVKTVEVGTLRTNKTIFGRIFERLC